MLKKCGMERRPLKSASSDADDGPIPRRNSVTESCHELSESETELSAGTPATPTGTSRRSSEAFLAPSATKLYPVSSLHLRCGGGPALPESPLSLVSPSPRTPSSLDSGISSLRASSLGGEKSRPHPLKPHLNHPPPIPTTPPPPLPPSKAPPLPPLELAAPPPLPPLSPCPPNNHGAPNIENISSDEEGPPVVRDPRRASLTRPSVDVLSPVSISPPFSPRVPASLRSLNHTTRSHLTFADPSLGLQTFVSAAGKPEAPPTTTSLVTPSYEPEVEDISGDESPVMVYNSTPNYDLQVGWL